MEAAATVRRARATHLLVSHVHVVVTERQGDWQSAAGVYSAEQHVRCSVTGFLTRDRHAHDGCDFVRPRQKNGARVRDHHNNAAAHGSDGVDERVLLGRQRQADAVGASVVFAGEGAVVAWRWENMR